MKTFMSCTTVCKASDRELGFRGLLVGDCGVEGDGGGAEGNGGDDVVECDIELRLFSESTRGGTSLFSIVDVGSVDSNSVSSSSSRGTKPCLWYI